MFLYCTTNGFWGLGAEIYLTQLNPLEFINGGSLAKKFLIRLDSNKAEQEKYYYQIKRFHNDILWLKEESYNH